MTEDVGSAGDADAVDGLDYASSGVDIDLEGASVASLIGALSGAARPARKSGEPGAPVDLPGGFGGLIEFGDNLLAMATDGVGSKLQIASMMGDWSGVGIDCMAMNVNDLLCVGAEAIAFVDYIAVPKPDPDQHAAIGASLAEACAQARVTLAGGETASLPGIVTELDLSGTALGWLPKGAAITGEHLAAGDVMIGLPASGIHSNGFSLVRKVVERSGLAYTDPAPFAPERRLGDVLLTPTRIYVDPVTDLIDACRAGEGPAPAAALKAICHVTGGGLSNLLRLHDSLGWHIDAPLPSLPEFDWVQAEGGISDREMARTFNLGMGMVIVVDPTHAAAVEAWLADRLAGSRAVGEVRDHGHRVTHVNPEIEFSHY